MNLDGEVIGINTAITSSNGGYQGVGFAIPIDTAKWVGGQLEQFGTVHRAYLGVVIQPVTQPLAEQFKVKSTAACWSRKSSPTAPRPRPGLKVGRHYSPVRGQAGFQPARIAEPRGNGQDRQHAAAEILRDGQKMTLERDLPRDARRICPGRQRARAARQARAFPVRALGIQVEDLTPELAEHLKLKGEHGVAITAVQPGSPADVAGLAAGMVITQANRHSIDTSGDLRKALDAQPLDKGVLLLVRSAEGSRFVVIRVESK